MSRKTITFKTFNTKSIENAIAEVKGRKQYTETRIRLIAQRLSDRGREIAESKCAQYTHGTGQLANSVEVWTEYADGCFRTFVKLNTPYAAYVEFGTGIVGAEDPHPRAQARGWEYDTGGYGEEGWFYPYNDARNHKYRVNPETGKLQPWTAGEPAKPIMYETLDQLRREFHMIAREVFSH